MKWTRGKFSKRLLQDEDGRFKERNDAKAEKKQKRKAWWVLQLFSDSLSNAGSNYLEDECGGWLGVAFSRLFCFVLFVLLSVR